MNLEELIELYRTQDYQFFKYRDKNGNDLNTHFIFETHKDYLDKYLGFYKELTNLTQVIVYATDGVFKLTNNGIEYFIRHNHQEVFEDMNGNLRGISYDISNQVKQNLIKRINDIMSANNFDSIYEIVENCRVKGFGPLATYDTAQRIAAKMNIKPDKIYLMAGARIGVKALEEKGYVEIGLSQKKLIEKEELPQQFKILSAEESHHCLCAMKSELAQLKETKANNT